MFSNDLVNLNSAPAFKLYTSFSVPSNIPFHSLLYLPIQEALGLAPRRDNKPRVNRLDKREQEELLKRSKAGEEVDKPYAQGERVQGLGFAPYV